jgi:adenylyltransferase/sulfurtransferase
MSESRYSRQEILSGIGQTGQQRIREAHVALVGLGALGSCIAEELTRAGVGFLRLIDRDYVEITNLQRQFLYTEEDVKTITPKAIAAATHLARINSEVELEPVVVDVHPGNAKELLAGCDLVMDGSDNFELRNLINEVCQKKGIPWVYGGVLGTYGMTANFLPGGPCFHCLTPESPPPGTYPTCATTGVLGPLTATVASLQTAEALKILIGSDAVARDLAIIELWNRGIEFIELSKDEQCPVCSKGNYVLLEKGLSDDMVTPLCAEGRYQVTPGRTSNIDLDAFASRLEAIGQVANNSYLLRFNGRGREVSFTLFHDGRAVIHNAKDEAHARSIYAEYIGS